jgi:hydroxylaminobenzene mutase
MNNLAYASRSNLRQGAVYMLVGLIWGMVVPATPFPRLALTAHIQLTANGIMFLVAGLVILRLPFAKSGLSAIILVAGPWLTWPVMLTEMVNAWWGARNMLPIAAGQAGAVGAQPWQETSVTVAHLIGALVLIVYWCVILTGLVRMPIKAKETTTDQPTA